MECFFIGELRTLIPKRSEVRWSLSTTSNWDAHNIIESDIMEMFVYGKEQEWKLRFLQSDLCTTFL